MFAVLSSGAQMQSKAQPYNAEENDAENEDEMEMEMDDEEKEMVAQGVAAAPPVPDVPRNMKIVRNYKRTAQAQDYDPTKFVVSPITGELVPIEQMAEHMRISLIDPRWREQREAMLSKIKTTTKVTRPLDSSTGSTNGNAREELGCAC